MQSFIFVGRHAPNVSAGHCHCCHLQIRLGNVAHERLFGGVETSVLGEGLVWLEGGGRRERRKEEEKKKRGEDWGRWGIGLLDGCSGSCFHGIEGNSGRTWTGTWSWIELYALF